MIGRQQPGNVANPVGMDRAKQVDLGDRHIAGRIMLLAHLLLNDVMEAQSKKAGYDPDLSRSLSSAAGTSVVSGSE